MNPTTATRKAFACLAILAAPALATAGNVSGIVKFEGATKPKRTEIKMDADGKCAAHTAGKKIGSEDYLINNANEIKNVFVYVSKGLEGKKFDVPATPAELDQVGCMYIPHVVGLMVGQDINIKNSDPTLHNIHGLPKVNQEFNFGQPQQNSVKTIKFRKAETGIKVKCDVHPWMSAWVHVLEHPFFAVSDKDGKYTIPGLPAGSYTLTAWHEKLGTVEQQITVADGDLAADFVLKGKEKAPAAGGN